MTFYKANAMNCTFFIQYFFHEKAIKIQARGKYASSNQKFQLEASKPTPAPSDDFEKEKETVSKLLFKFIFKLFLKCYYTLTHTWASNGFFGGARGGIQ